MKTNSVVEIWDAIAETNSTKEKLNILKENSDNIWLAKWLEYTYNPYKTYGIRGVPSEVWENFNESVIYDVNDVFFGLLDQLQDRTLSGNAAKQAVYDFCVKAGKDLTDLFNAVLNKDIDAGISTTTINKAFPNLIPVFSIAKANPFDNSLQYPVTAELKMNGVRLITIVDDGAVTFLSSNGREASGLDNIKSAILDSLESSLPSIPHLVLDGELTANNRKSVSGIFNKALKGTIQESDTADLRYTLFDILPFSEWEQNHSTIPLTQRRKHLEYVISHNSSKHLDIVQSRTLHSLAEVQEFYNEVYEQGEEGLIIKNPDATYHFGRSAQFQKIKSVKEADLVITGFTQGTGKRSNFIGAISVESADGKIKVDVGSGLTDKDLEYFTENQEQLIGRIITIEYNELIQNKDEQYSLFLPRFVELRNDKLIPDTFEKIVAESNGSEM